MELVELFREALEDEQQGATGAISYSNVTRIESDSTFLDNGIIGENNIARLRNNGGANYICATLSNADYKDSGNLDTLVSTRSEALIDGIGTGIITYATGSDSIVSLNSENVFVGRLSASRHIVELTAGTAGDVFVSTIDFNYHGNGFDQGVIDGKFAYLKIFDDSHNMPPVGVYARAIDSDSTFPSVFAGSMQATTYYGDGSNLTGITGTSIANRFDQELNTFNEVKFLSAIVDNLSIESDTFILSSSVSSAGQYTIDGSQATGNYEVSFPDKGGTFAFLDDVNSHNPFNQDLNTTNNVTFERVYSNNEATGASELVRLDQMNSAIAGLNWQAAVLDQIDMTVSEPPTPTIGDRYINLVTGISSSTGQSITINHIYEWDGLVWADNTPQEGWTVWDESNDQNYTYHSGAWNEFGSTVSHNNTTGLQGGTAAEYYHLSLSEYTKVGTVETNANYITNNNQLTNGAGYITTYTVTQSDVTSHQSALVITESQISDLTHVTNNNQLTNGADYVTNTEITTALANAAYKNINNNFTVSQTITGGLEVSEGIKVGNDSNIASASNAGTHRYRSNANNSYVDMCMQTGATTYEWINIVQNNW